MNGTHAAVSVRNTRFPVSSAIVMLRTSTPLQRSSFPKNKICSLAALLDRICRIAFIVFTNQVSPSDTLFRSSGANLYMSPAPIAIKTISSALLPPTL